MKPSRRELVENPPAAERRAIKRRIRLLPLMRREAPGEIDWPLLAGRMAVELSAMVARLDGDPVASEADQERAARGHLVLRDFRAAVAAEIEAAGPAVVPQKIRDA